MPGRLPSGSHPLPTEREEGGGLQLPATERKDPEHPGGPIELPRYTGQIDDSREPSRTEPRHISTPPFHQHVELEHGRLDRKIDDDLPGLQLEIVCQSVLKCALPRRIALQPRVEPPALQVRRGEFQGPLGK